MKAGRPAVGRPASIARNLASVKLGWNNQSWRKKSPNKVGQEP